MQNYFIPLLTVWVNFAIYATIFPSFLLFSRNIKKNSVKKLKKGLVTFRSLFQGSKKIVINILDLSLVKILILCIDTHIQPIPISPAEQNC